MKLTEDISKKYKINEAKPIEVKVAKFINTLGDNGNDYNVAVRKSSGDIRKYLITVVQDKNAYRDFLSRDDLEKYIFEEKDDIDEMNVTGNMDGGEGPPKVPGAFAKRTKDTEDGAGNGKLLGYTNVNKKQVRRNFKESKLIKLKEDYIHILKRNDGYAIMHSKFEDPKLGGQIIKGKMSKNDANSFAEKMAKRWKSKIKSESTYKKIMGELHEVSYPEYRDDEKVSQKNKVNNSIKEINRKLFEIERIAKQNVRLKTETGVASDKYWKSTKTKLIKIAERMIRVSKMIRELNG